MSATAAVPSFRKGRGLADSSQDTLASRGPHYRAKSCPPPRGVLHSSCRLPRLGPLRQCISKLIGFSLFFECCLHAAAFPSLAYSAGCSDSDTRCAQWAAAGECVQNAGFMRAHCQSSCDSCEYDVADFAPPQLRASAAEEKLLMSGSGPSGTCVQQPPQLLRWGVNASTALHIGCFNRKGAEAAGSWEHTPLLDALLSATEASAVTFYDSATSRPLFVAPRNRSAEAMVRESRRHGWPSLRNAEVVGAHVRVLRGGEVVSIDGTHLGHLLPDAKARYCINLVSIAGLPPSNQAKAAKKHDHLSKPDQAPTPDIFAKPDTTEEIETAEQAKQAEQAEAVCNGSEGLHLVTTLFKSPTLSGLRLEEQLYSLRRNLANPHIERVHLFAESVSVHALPSHLKLSVHAAPQPTYKQLLGCANQLRDAVVVVANADVFFDETLGCVDASRLRNKKKVFAISRVPAPHCVLDANGTELNRTRSAARDMCALNQFSHDAFIFASPLPQQLLDKLDFFQNYEGAENVVVYELTKAGYSVRNACLHIRALHQHCTNERHWHRSQISNGRKRKLIPTRIAELENCANKSVGASRELPVVSPVGRSARIRT